MERIFPQDAALFRWGPAPIRTFYTDDFLEGIFTEHYFRAAFPGEEWPKGLALYNEGRMVFADELQEIERCGASLFLKWMLPLEPRQEIFNKWLEDLNRLHRVEKSVTEADVRFLSNEDLLKLWQELHAETIRFWTHVTVPELANYGSLPLLEKALLGYVPAAELHTVMEILTAPEKPSFYQKEEIELAETSDIAAHTQKYFWLKNSYKNTMMLGEDFFLEHKKELSVSIRAEFEAKQAETKQRKVDCITKYSLPRNIIEMAEAIVFGIEWQDDRKEEIFIYLHYKDLLLTEVCRRFQYEKNDLLNFRIAEIEELFKGGDLRLEVDKRHSAYGFLCYQGKVTKLGEEEGRAAWELYSEEHLSGDHELLRGAVASRAEEGMVRGKVRIVLDPHEYGDFPEGDILVAPMTTPEYIFLMKRAAAVITDTGGLTSHAAIVSRELKKPCLVGTKLATKIFKDGDLVEVDTDKGTAVLVKAS